jgi:glycopeptide antibiotics resistance protein
MFCVFVIVYASLQPFTEWSTDTVSPFAFLFDFDKRWLRADIIFNVLAYVPLGITLSAAWPTSWGLRTRWLLSLFAALALSLMMETLQSGLPSRYSNINDTMANVLGAALGGLLAVYLMRFTRLLSSIRWLRETLFVAGATGEMKIILLLAWLVAQVNPGIPLFASSFHLGLSAANEPAVIAVELVQTAAALIGIGLFTDLAMRKRWLGGLALIVVIATAITLKTTAAQWFLTPVAWETWLRAGHTLGLAVGALSLTVLFWLPRRAKSIIAGIALLLGIFASLLLPDTFIAKAPLSLFNWHYGQLLNLNGLTHTIIMLWPFAATAVLLLRYTSDAPVSLQHEARNAESIRQN